MKTLKTKYMQFIGEMGASIKVDPKNLFAPKQTKAPIGYPVTGKPFYKSQTQPPPKPAIRTEIAGQPVIIAPTPSTAITGKPAVIPITPKEAATVAKDVEEIEIKKGDKKPYALYIGGGLLALGIILSMTGAFKKKARR